jgi:hypothetical protein
MVKPPLRTKSIGFKVSEEEYAQLETAAQAEGRTLGVADHASQRAAALETYAGGASLSRLRSATSFRRRVFSSRNCLFASLHCFPSCRAASH